ncbi:MAG TPA: FAD-dependent oxidoreductase [Gaiellaceae bacterium]|nr:FAD-dependent oxidoreductase [Gaiellaceae bacterium]
MLVAVVGAGVNGLAAAASLARDGHEVVVHEQHELDHHRGSSHGRSRIFRLSYPEPHWVQLAMEAHDGWRALEEETGELLIEYTGLLELGETSEEALDACGVPWEALEPDAVALRFGIRAEGRVLLQPEAGISLADRARRAFVSVARRHGATFRERARVESLAALDADVVIVAAGGWAKPLLAAEGIALDVAVTRETVAYFALERSVPSVIDYGRGPGEAMYALRDPVHGLKAGAHVAGPVANPDEAGKPEPALVDATAEWVRERFPEAGPVVAAETCLYTSTPDHSFVLERHGRIVVGSACSGHGFKFAPAVGTRLAALATG